MEIRVGTIEEARYLEGEGFELIDRYFSHLSNRTQYTMIKRPRVSKEKTALELVNELTRMLEKD